MKFFTVSLLTLASVALAAPQIVARDLEVVSGGNGGVGGSGGNGGSGGGGLIGGSGGDAGDGGNAGGSGSTQVNGGDTVEDKAEGLIGLLRNLLGN